MKYAFLFTIIKRKYMEPNSSIEEFFVYCCIRMCMLCLYTRVVGDVVINIDERYPKNTWPKGIVEEVFVAKDGRIRQVLVRFQKSVLKRPVSKLAILNLSPPNEEEVKLDRTTGPINGGKDVGQRCKDDNTDSTMRLPDGNKK
ncbi:hypothetical protein HA402_005729 [Bradysia odoriphaga]|nr:hypothetical protein HA402_005729 [Bradysia odoriphaga]